MSQNVVNYSDNPTGPELLDNYLAKSQENELTNNSGIQRPSYARAGTSWIDTSTTPWTWYLYDGSRDIAIGTFNVSTHEFISANVVNLTTNQTVDGLKTFAKKPRVPTPTSSDNTATVINIAYLNDPTKSTGVMHLTGNETAAGEKTFTDKLTVDDNILITNNQNTYRHVYTDNSAITKGIVPSSTTGTEFLLRDSNNAPIGSVAVWYSTGRTCVSGLRAYNPQAGTTDNVSLQLHYDYNGATFATCPTPTSLDNSDKIVTCKLINQSIEQVHVVIDSYKNGTSWYRVYDDGWVEQGGNFMSTSSTTNISLLKSFIDNSYNIQITDGGNGRICYGYNKNSNSSFTIYGTASNQGGSWEAKGIGA